MAVYIDSFNAPYRGMIMCHMVADSKEELLEMARKIGVNTKWIQHEGEWGEHFDICQSKKAKALKLGAKEITLREIADFWNRKKPKKMSKPTHTLAIDCETFSDVDIKKSGAYKYCASPVFEVLILAYKIDNEPTRLLDLTDPDTIDSFEKMLLDPDYLKVAFNAPFERAVLSAWLKVPMPPDQWECTLAKAYSCGLSGGLDQVSQILKVGEKMKEGYSLIRYFCVPCKPSKVNGGRTRNLPHHDTEKFVRFEQYCKKDVELECEIRRILNHFTLAEGERELWILDQKINDRGVTLDPVLIKNAISFAAGYNDKLLARAVEITGLKNPKSTAQLKAWLEEELDEELESLGKDKLPALLKKSKGKLPDVHEMVTLRQQINKTSNKKYDKMMHCIMSDQKVRGLFQFCGASRTGRWGGRLCQPQNFPKNDMEDLHIARQLVADGDKFFFDCFYDTVSHNTGISYTLSQLLRTAFIPSPGCRFIVSDFAAIEARIAAWLAGEEWRLNVFRGDGKIYEASASKMFGVPLDQITKELRYRGKVAELALGFGGAVGALLRMLKTEATKKGLAEIEIPERDLPGIVQSWRIASPSIVQCWWNIDRACMEAVENPGLETMPDDIQAQVLFQVKNNVLFLTLPSGRKLCYLRPRIIEGKFGPCVSYEGMEADSKKWGRVETYGAKLFENIVQATARDLLAAAMLRLDAASYEIALHVHDEAVLDVPHGKGSIEEVNKIMTVLPSWAAGLPIGAESFETNFYKKE